MKISMTVSVPDCKLYTWISVMSNMHVFLKILKQLFFGTFQNSCFNSLARLISKCFCKTPGLFAVLAFHFPWVFTLPCYHIEYVTHCFTEYLSVIFLWAKTIQKLTLSFYYTTNNAQTYECFQFINEKFKIVITYNF